MLHDFAEHAPKYGLKLNLDKTKVMTWDHYRHGCPEVVVGHSSVQVLGEDSTDKYLGRRLVFADSCLVELESRALTDDVEAIGQQFCGVASACAVILE